MPAAHPSGFPPEQHFPTGEHQGVSAPVPMHAGERAGAAGVHGHGPAPRIVTTGGNPFPPLMAGPLPALAHVDWLAFTLVPPEGDPLSWLFPQLAKLFGIPFMESRQKGAFGYSRSFDLGGLGILALGGKGQKGTIYVSISGTGCAHVGDWQQVQAWLENIGARIKRVDLAHDDIQGETLSIERAVEWYNGDGFSAGGRQPGHQVKGDWLTPGSPKGRTLYVGNRANGKMARIYEKGKQLGDTESPWVRAEVEFKDTSRILPYDMLTRPGVYLAGAYTCFGFLSVIQEKIRTIAKAAKITLAALVYYARQCYGPLINVLMVSCGKDAVAVIAQLIRPGVPRRLAPYAGFPPDMAEAAT